MTAGHWGHGPHINLSFFFFSYPRIEPFKWFAFSSIVQFMAGQPLVVIRHIEQVHGPQPSHSDTSELDRGALQRIL
jgi:hypothetical protein